MQELPVQDPPIWTVLSTPCLHEDSGPSDRPITAAGHRTVPLPRQPFPCGVHDKPKEVRSFPYIGPSIHRGQVLHRPGQATPVRPNGSRSDYLRMRLLQSRGIQSSPAIPGPARTDCSNLADSGIYHTQWYLM